MIQWNGLAAIFIVRKVLKIFDFVALLMCPLDPTSKGIKRHLKPLSSKSFFSAAYLRDFLKNAACEFLSKLQVSSSKQIIFSCLFKSTKSGLDCVTRISGGIVPPFKSRPEILARACGVPAVGVRAVDCWQ